MKFSLLVTEESKDIMQIVGFFLLFLGIISREGQCDILYLC